MATIKAIEGRSVHQIQSGQVIVDLCSVVKELLENSLDAGATSIDIRFKNNGLDSIEVQDNGSGIAPEDYETIALKHYTSKLSDYDDLSTLDTFGFRGEALSSLCALSNFHVITTREGEAPKGKKLDFEVSGKLKGTTIAACLKGTTVAVENLFYNLPVRRRELEKNIKREYGKVLGILHAYACISTSVKISVSNQMPKGKKMIVFSTKANPTTKDNLANVFGAKTLLALIPLDLELELRPTTSQVLTDIHTQGGVTSRQVKIVGHISRPVYGEGRQTPDRQMFFVNSRPCGLPQIAKAFNEVYKSYNSSQSPFIVANLEMDTNAYDVNVSPDKRTIMLHDQTALLEVIKDSLAKMFDAQDQTMPQAQMSTAKLPSFRPLTITREASTELKEGNHRGGGISTEQPRLIQSSGMTAGSTAISSDASSLGHSQDGVPTDLLSKFVSRDVEDREELVGITKRNRATARHVDISVLSKEKQKLFNKFERQSVTHVSTPLADHAAIESENEEVSEDGLPQLPRIVQDFNDRIASQQVRSAQKRQDVPSDSAGDVVVGELSIPALAVSPRKDVPGVVQSAFDRMRPKRPLLEAATITIGSKTSTAIIGSGTPAFKKRRTEPSKNSASISQPSQFARGLQAFAAPGTQADAVVDNEAETESDELDSSQSHGEDTDGDASSLVAGVDSDIASVSTDLQDQDQEQDEDSDGEYVDEAQRKKLEEKRIAQLVQEAEDAAVQPTQANQKRAAGLLRSNMHKESTLNLNRFLATSVESIRDQLALLNATVNDFATNRSSVEFDQLEPASTNASAEERLSLTISKSDFAEMRIVGQFNLGFILTTRSTKSSTDDQAFASHDSPADLFIIDQHASDEIYNFSRLSQTTTLTPQPLVHPHLLELTAIEEETILAHPAILTANGFTIAVDTSGASPVGRRCRLLTLPTSRDAVFSPRDLEELLALLGEASPTAGEIVRPTRVRRMLAMRACRSSVMVGRTLTESGMRRVVRHMGEIERPWNCPHGRPTMRHLAGLGDWNGWMEGEGLLDEMGEAEEDGAGGKEDWRQFLERVRKTGLLDGIPAAGEECDGDGARELDGSDESESEDGNIMDDRAEKDEEDEREGGSCHDEDDDEANGDDHNDEDREQEERATHDEDDGEEEEE